MKAYSRLTAIAPTAVVCFAATSFGSAIALAGAQESLVRPAPGVALSLLLLLGVEVWPGVLAGVFLAAITAREPALVALATAAGVALEAVVAARLLRRFAGLDQTFDTLRHAVGLT
jgi:integral membrane sensor domain MASE1